jgi:hypothetical protein
MKNFAYMLMVAVVTMPAAFGQMAYTGDPPAAPASSVAGPQERVGSGLLSLAPSSDPGVQKAQQLLEQMVQALGGQAYLNIQDMQQTGRTYSFYHGESTGPGALYWRFWKWPDKERVELTKQRDWFMVYAGDKGYEITFRGTALIEQEVLDDYLRRREHSLPVVLRKWLREPGVALFYDGQGLAERRQTDRVTVLTAGNDSATIYIDSESHLPRKISFSWRDPKSHDRTEDAEGYDAYRPAQGIMTAFSVTRYRDGEAVNQRFITETKYNQNLADSMFNASATWDPKQPVRAKKK